MSLDVYLTTPKSEPTEAARAVALLREHHLDEMATVIECRFDCGDTNEVYSANITHNLGKMAEAAGIYKCLWRPDEIGISKAWQLIDPLEKGLALLKSDPPRFEAFNSPNGWGLYKHFVPFVSNYLQACKDNPSADVSVSR